ncbi:bcl-2/adenovirus E1B 19 kDa-interacting protein 2-like protein isoform X2 [Rana temporaria]|nr:bcl-2/adenovirus E1B 19 kDa-interacting protein 2-like protein isoform X2 [Rana temporaria]XP_040189655.1 bcl-2/adenovirus E1B 19 kDa-interacting protein 2-like protein isoform X2 [Rana temporaria]XP_040189656.1 bcl-2/adenovirus E1B 19 kDa-interacting protein 2-like protein isoform X2 [Rana temporaria]
MELKEEWQDEEFPRPLPEETTPEEDLDANEEDLSAAPPSTLDLCGNRHVKRRLSAPDISFNLENSQDSATSSDIRDQTTDEDLDFDVDDLETPNSSEMLEFPSMSHEFEWDDDLPKVNGTPEASFVETLVSDMEDQSGRRWRIFLMGEHKVDMTAIEPYRKVVSHGGYYGNSLNAIVVFATCYLPESSIPNYQYIMDNLFRYIIGTLDLLVADDYMLIYLSGCTSRSKIPPIGWLKRCYRATGRRLKKNLKSVLIVHPTWYVRALLAIIRPFISAKFIRKVAFVKNLTELSQLVSLDPLHIPDCIEQLDLELKR